MKDKHRRLMIKIFFFASHSTSYFKFVSNDTVSFSFNSCFFSSLVILCSGQVIFVQLTPKENIMSTGFEDNFLSTL